MIDIIAGHLAGDYSLESMNPMGESSLPDTLSLFIDDSKITIIDKESQRILFAGIPHQTVTDKIESYNEEYNVVLSFSRDECNLTIFEMSEKDNTPPRKYKYSKIN